MHHEWFKLLAVAMAGICFGFIAGMRFLAWSMQRQFQKALKAQQAMFGKGAAGLPAGFTRGDLSGPTVKLEPVPGPEEKDPKARNLPG